MLKKALYLLYLLLLTYKLLIMRIKDLGKYSLELDKRGFLRIRHKSDTTFDIDDAIAQRNEITKFCDHQKMPFLIDMRVTNWSADKEVREFHASDKDLLAIKNAEAILVNNLGIRILANAYQRVNRPPVPVKVFTDENKAIEWIQALSSHSTTPR